MTRSAGYCRNVFNVRMNSRYVRSVCNGKTLNWRGLVETFHFSLEFSLSISLIYLTLTSLLFSESFPQLNRQSERSTKGKIICRRIRIRSNNTLQKRRKSKKILYCSFHYHRDFIRNKQTAPLRSMSANKCVY